MKNTHLCSADQKLEWWGPGEWIEEPDLVEWEYKGINCKISRSATLYEWPSEVIFGGHLCGYCNIPKNHLWFGKSWGDIGCNVHGGLSYYELEDDGYWIGFDCGHSRDLIPSMENQKIYHQIDKNIKYIYDELNLHDLFFSRSYKNIQFCIDECESIVDQMLAINTNVEI